MPAPPTKPLVATTTTVELPEDLARTTLRESGFGDLLFASAAADGSLAALMMNSQKPGVVFVLRIDADGEVTVEGREGNLIPAGSPLLGGYDEATGEVHFADLVRGAHYRVARYVSTNPNDTGVAWYEDRTLWRLPADRPDRGLLRAVTNSRLTWTLIDFMVPGEISPAWRLALRPSDEPAIVADAVLSPDGERVVLQLTDGKRASRLVALDSRTGKVSWRTDTGPVSYFGSGALVVSDDGQELATVVSDFDRCETCEKVEVHELLSGRLIRAVPLERSFILDRQRHVEAYLGFIENELWYRFRRGPQPLDSMKAEACTYDVFDLKTGRKRATDAAWVNAFDDCRQPLYALPIRGGMLGLRVLDRTELAVTRFARAP